MEKEIIGFYVSGHPLDAYGKLLKNKVSHKIESLEEAEHGEKVRVGGMVASVRHLLTKRGDSMATFVLEDQTESIKCIVFPKAYAACRDKMFAAKVLIAEGKLKKDEAKPEMIVEKIESPGKLYLRLPDSNDKILVAQIKEFLLKIPGDIEISVYYEDLKQYYCLPGIAGVALDDKMIMVLKEFLNEENVVLR
ncbi:Error-prone DNA polymerase [bioreactor metagenome]|uniref:Error-prone DNA polymerase n=1 Tax=bioreactor metagenome TaxID=1076179 RepID=A0A645G7W0_9ZZZZ